MLRKINTFIHVFLNSLLPLDTYYKKLKTAPFKFSFKYFLALMFMIATFSGLAISHKLLITKDSLHIYKEINSVLENYPENLVIRIKNGQLMTSFDRPYIVFMTIDSVPRPILVIDEFATPGKRDLYRTPILLTGSSVVINIDDTTQVMRYEPGLDVKVTKSNIDLVKNRLKIVSIIFPAILLSLLLFFITIYFVFMTIMAMLILALLSIVYFLIVRRMVPTLTFSKTWQISLHSATLPIILGTVTSLTRLTPPSPLMIPFIYVLFLGAALYEVYYAGPKR